jgi:hypothetical protein
MPPDYSSNSDQHWAMIHDARGNLLQVASIRPGETLDFQSKSDTIPENLQFTILTVDTSEKRADTYWIESFVELKTGAMVTLTPGLRKRVLPPSYGTFQITIPNILQPMWGIVSTKNGYNNYTSASIYEQGKDGFTLIFNCPIEHPGSEYLLSMEDMDGNVRYQFLRDIKDGGQDTIQVGDLTMAEKYIDVSLPMDAIGSSLNVVAFEDNQVMEDMAGYPLTRLTLPAFSKSRRLPYLERFNRYTTKLSVVYQNYSELIYFKRGTAPIAPITFPENLEVRLDDRTFKTFEVSRASSYALRQNSFYYEDNTGSKRAEIMWTFYSPRGDKRIFFFQDNAYEIYLKQRLFGEPKPETEEYFYFRIPERK